jgi:hypothetical protein
VLTILLQALVLASFATFSDTWLDSDWFGSFGASAPRAEIQLQK